MEIPSACFSGPVCPSVRDMCKGVGGQSHTSSEEAGRNTLQPGQPMRSRGWWRRPFQETSGEYQGFRPPADFLIYTTDCSICPSVCFFAVYFYFQPQFIPLSIYSSILPCNHPCSCSVTTPLTFSNLWLDPSYPRSIRAYILPPSLLVIEKYGGILCFAAIAMSSDMSAPSMRKKKSFARSSKPSVRMCIWEQRDVM